MSNSSKLNMLRYWRNTLADAARVIIEIDKTLNQRNANININKGTVDCKQTLTLLKAFEKRMNEHKGRLDPKDTGWEKVEEASVVITCFRVSPMPEYTKLTGGKGIFYLFCLRAVLTRNPIIVINNSLYKFFLQLYDFTNQ